MVFALLISEQRCIVEGPQACHFPFELGGKVFTHCTRHGNAMDSFHCLGSDFKMHECEMDSEECGEIAKMIYVSIH